MTTRLLLIDDDPTLCELLREYLSEEGFFVDTANEGTRALEKLRTSAFDIVVLDVMLPGRNGFELLRELRGAFSTPVLMLTARGEDIDRIVGLEIGADDYLAKPCNPRELVARLRAILRRARPLPAWQPETLKVGDLELQPAARVVRLNGVVLELTSTEFDVLEVLLREPGRVLTKDRLMTAALRRKLGRFDRSLDMHVSRLRRKLGALPNGEERIKTVRNKGYLYAQHADTVGLP